MDDSASTSRLEVIKDLKVMMKDMLKAFYHATKHKPERIIFFRDGVSEGQFMDVRNHEGTSGPSHYYIVWDGSSFTSDELQKLCYYLYHTYARCSHSVSIPAPVYYAHLAAYRSRNQVKSKADVSSSSGDSSGGSADSVSISQ
ncbi:protein argonaute-2-like [Amblyomma americanum]